MTRPTTKPGGIGAALALLVAGWLALGLPGGPAPAQPDPLREQAAGLAAFIEAYYRAPDPAGAIDRLARLDVAGLLASDDEARASQVLAVLAAFYAQVVRAAPELADALADRVIASGRPDNALVAAIALATADTPASRGALQSLTEAGLLGPAARAEIGAMGGQSFETMTAQSHYDIDLLWVSFYATGDPVFIERIAEALAYWDEASARGYTVPPAPGRAAAEAPERRLAVIRVFAALAARETLTANAGRHPVVLLTLRRIAAERTDRVGAISASILAEALAAQ